MYIPVYDSFNMIHLTSKCISCLYLYSGFGPFEGAYTISVTCADPVATVAEFDEVLGAPKCSAVETSCTTGALVKGKANNYEPNSSTSNTIDGCTDGSAGSYHGDESVDKVTISSADGGPLQEGALATVNAKVWAWGSGSSDTVEFYHTNDVVNPTWEFFGSVVPPAGGAQTLSMNTLLTNSTMQAVRVRIRYSGSQGSCMNGSWDDQDDLAFAVETGVAGSLSSDPAKLGPIPMADPISSSICGGLESDRCNGASDLCSWDNDNMFCIAK